MPEIFYQPTDRRAFLRSAALATFALGIAGTRTIHSQARKSGELHLALLSDTHIPGDRVNGHRGFNPWENLKRIVPDVQQTAPEGTIICGDAARLAGLPDDYVELRALLEPLAARAPVYIALGNHDDRANFRKAFPTPPGTRAQVADKHVVVIDSEPVKILVLDSLLYVDKVAGLLGKNQREWLNNYLPANSNKPIVLFVHHTLTDNDGDLLDADRLFAILAPHRQVKAIFFGHSHVWSITQRDQLQMINLPAVGYNFRDQDPVGWVDARFHSKGVDLTLRAFAGNKAEDGKVTRVEWL
jgi:3',5'-cyclic-AMP phosphodiesterase